MLTNNLVNIFYPILLFWKNFKLLFVKKKEYLNYLIFGSTTEMFGEDSVRMQCICTWGWLRTERESNVVTRKCHVIDGGQTREKIRHVSMVHHITHTWESSQWSALCIWGYTEWRCIYCTLCSLLCRLVLKVISSFSTLMK